MLAAGDYDLMRVILDYISNLNVLLTQRTQVYWNHSGAWTTETHHLTGAYDGSDYGCGDRTGWPVWLMQSGYLHLDWAGDSGTGMCTIRSASLTLAHVLSHTSKRVLPLFRRRSNHGP
jgi:hypothetical protein